MARISGSWLYEMRAVKFLEYYDQVVAAEKRKADAIRRQNKK